MIQIERGVPFAATNSGGPATATQTGVAKQSIYVTDVSGSSDLSTATLSVKDGTTVIWEEKIGNTMPYQHTFAVPLKITSGANASVVVTATITAYANIAGVIIDDN